MASPHDALFKYAFTDVEEARPLLRSVAPPELVAEIDWSTLEVAPGSFVDEALSNRHSDILYQALMGGEAVLLYLLVEHQSTVDRLMAYRMLRYVARIWDRWLRDHDGVGDLPQVVPIVVYAGELDWDAPTAVDTLVRGETRSWTPQMSFILDDLSRLTDEQLHARQLNVFAELTVLALARLRGSRDPLGLVESWLPSLSRLLAARNGLERFRALIEYLAVVADVEPSALQPVVRQLGPAAEETAMTLAERLRQQGREQGDHQGQAKVILRLLRLKFGELPEAITAKVEAGTEADFERWTERVLVATTLDQVFDAASGA